MTQHQRPDLESLRTAFPITRQCAYLNHAAVAPLSNPVRDAMEDYLSHRTHGEANTRYEQLSDDLRDAVARLINARAEEIAFVQNTSEGLNIIANALPLEPGDNVLFCDMEFPSNVYPWMNLERRGIEARCIPHDGGGLTVAALQAHADERTRAVAVSSVEFLTGFRSDLEALSSWCDAHDTTLVVDGIQSLGVLPMDVQASRVDCLSCGGPKWLMGPAGQGFLYVRRDLLDELHPPFAGCISVAGWENWRDYQLAFLPDARRFELGCGNLVGQVGLLAAVELLLTVGIEAIKAWTLHLTDLLIQDLEQRGYEMISNTSPERRSAIVSFSLLGDIGQAYDRLVGENVIIARRENVIRVSPHCYNTEAEVLRVGQVLGDAHD
jgi:selenocysteine lyase/cysteine desulfurase